MFGPEGTLQPYSFFETYSGNLKNKKKGGSGGNSEAKHPLTAEENGALEAVVTREYRGKDCRRRQAGE